MHRLKPFEPKSELVLPDSDRKNFGRISELILRIA